MFYGVNKRNISLLSAVWVFFDTILIVASSVLVNWLCMWTAMTGHIVTATTVATTIQRIFSTTITYST